MAAASTAMEFSMDAETQRIGHYHKTLRGSAAAMQAPGAEYSHAGPSSVLMPGARTGQQQAAAVPVPPPASTAAAGRGVAAAQQAHSDPPAAAAAADTAEAVVVDSDSDDELDEDRYRDQVSPEQYNSALNRAIRASQAIPCSQAPAARQRLGTQHAAAPGTQRGTQQPGGHAGLHGLQDAAMGLPHGSQARHDDVLVDADGCEDAAADGAGNGSGTTTGSDEELPLNLSAYLPPELCEAYKRESSVETIYEWQVGTGEAIYVSIGNL